MSFHIFHINEAFSNAHGTIQYLEFVGEADGQNQWAGRSITSSDGVTTKTFNIPSNLSSVATTGKSVLLATQAFADLGLVTPDFIIPNGFLFPGGGTIDFIGMNEGTLVYDALPTDGFHGLNHEGVEGVATPSNFAGSSISIEMGLIPAGEVVEGTAGNDTLAGGSGYDAVFGAAGNDKLTGLGGKDILNGGDGNDTIDGGIDNDTMVGGKGNDIYTVNAAGDKVTEAAGTGTGTDTVKSSVTETLDINVEKLLLTGSGAINGNGNASDNTLTGNSGNNVLDGKAGADTLKGMGGNDTLIWASTDTLDGGDGADNLKFTVGNLNLATTLDARILNFETINMTGGAGSTLTLNAAEVLNISTTSNQLKVLGDATDTVDITGAFTDAGMVAGGFHKYTFAGGGILLVEGEVTVI